MSWPEVSEREQAEAMDRQARASTVAIAGRSFEEMVMATLAARAQQDAETAAALAGEPTE